MLMNLDEKAINQIVEAVVRKLSEQSAGGGGVQPGKALPKTPSGAQDGVFQDIEDAIRAA
jgi:hypothetical protein